MNLPFYDTTKTYEENYENGPVGKFADGKRYEQTGQPSLEYHGQKLYAPFGIPAGPLLNSKYVKAAFEKGFDIAIYKTVRSDIYPCHPFPNILSVKVDGDLTMEKLQKPLLADSTFTAPIAITNSFNIPSKKAQLWQEDMKKALSYASSGQVMIGSFVGTVREGQTHDEFVADWALVAKQVVDTGVKIIEADISCPNNGAEGLVCYDLKTTEEICKAIRQAIGDTPLILKIGYYENQEQLEKLAAIADRYADGIAGINTLAGTIVNDKGEQALPGKNRAKGGVCGAPIKWAGVETVRRLHAIRQQKNYTFTIDGVGGVTSAADYQEYREAGADAVFSATGAMWNPDLAAEIKASL